MCGSWPARLFVCLSVRAHAGLQLVRACTPACVRARACARAYARARWRTSTRKCVQAPVFCIWDCSYVVLRVRVWVFVWRLNVRACVCCFGCRCGCGVSARVGCGSARACARAPARAWACFSTQGVLIWHSLSRLRASESSAWARVAVCMNARVALRVGLRAWRCLRARWSRAQSRVHLLSARVSVFGVLCARVRAFKCALPAARLLACVFSWACAGLRFARARGLLAWVAGAVARLSFVCVRVSVPLSACPRLHYRVRVASSARACLCDHDGVRGFAACVCL